LVGESFKKKKNPVNKNQANIFAGWEPIQQKHNSNENTSTHNPKKKQKQTINKKSGKDTKQWGLMVTKWQSMITKKDLRQKSSPLPQVDSKKEWYQSTEDLQKGMTIK